MSSSAVDICSAGDCCEGMDLQSGKNMIIGLWAKAAHQGITAGANMTGTEADYTGNFLHNITHFIGMDFIGYGINRVKGEVIASVYIRSDLYVEAVITEKGLCRGQYVGQLQDQRSSQERSLWNLREQTD